MALYVAVLIGGSINFLFFLPAQIPYHITEHYTFHTDQPYAQVHLAVMLPISGPYQHVQNLVTEWPGELDQILHEGSEVYFFGGESGEDGSVTARIAYDAILQQDTASWETPVRQEDLTPEAWIESDAPALVA